jgi:signal transduction histidine kinase
MAVAAPRPDHPGMPSVVPGLRRLALDTVYLVLGLPAGILTFTWVVTGWALSLGLAITLIGLPLGVVTILGSRWLARMERHRAALVLGKPVPERYRAPRSGRIIDRLKALLADASTWKDLAWHLLLLPLGILGFTVAVAGWTFALGGLSVPLWWWIPPDTPVQWIGITVDSWWWALLCFGMGLVALPIAIALVRATAAGSGALATIILGPGRQELEERVEALTETRAGAVDAAAAELSRIERDLHDGAQARLVALALDLGMAEDRFERDPDGARELVEKARGEAKLALGELRDLARGIRPAMLSERGLVEALLAFAARSPLPATVTTDVEGKLPERVELAAYFVVAEALTNAAKHSGGTRAQVRLVREDGRLAVEVSDDGRGGADPRGEGFEGLRRRVAALDGTLRVASPPGGPTLVRAELPCAS